MKKTFIEKILAVLLMALAAGSGLAGCAGGKQVRMDDYLPAYEGQITADVLRAHAFTHIVNSVRAEVTGEFSSGGDGGRSAFAGVFAFRSPSDLRLRLFGPLGATVVDMVNAGGVLQIHDSARQKIYEGPQLFNSTPSEVDPYIVHRDGLIYFVQYAHDKDGYQLPDKVFVYDERTLRNVGILLYRDGAPFIDLTFSEFSSWVPGRVRMAIANGPVIDLQLQEPEVNMEVPDKVFRLVSHEGNEILPISAIDRMSFR